MDLGKYVAEVVFFLLVATEARMMWGTAVLRPDEMKQEVHGAGIYTVQLDSDSSVPKWATSPHGVMRQVSRCTCKFLASILPSAYCVAC